MDELYRWCDYYKAETGDQEIKRKAKFFHINICNKVLDKI